MVLVEIPKQQSFVTVYCFYLKPPLGIYTFLVLSSLSCTQLLRPSFSQNVTYDCLYQNHLESESALLKFRFPGPSADFLKWNLWEWILEIHIFNFCVPL